MTKDEMEIIEAEACTIVDESFVKQARELLDREERSEMAKMLKMILDHYEKTAGKVIHIFELSCTPLSSSLCRTLYQQEAWIILSYQAIGELKR